MKRSQLSSAAVGALCLFAAAGSLMAEASKPTPLQRVLTADIPAGSLRKIALAGGDGQARIVAVPGNTIRVRLEVSPQPLGKRDFGDLLRSWFLRSAYESDEALIQAVRLVSRSADGRLELGLTPPTRSRHQRLKELWTLEVPPQLALDLDLAAADVDVKGMAGGLTVDLGVGKATVSVPSGDIDVEIGVGDAAVRTTSDSIRQVKLGSDVGSTRLWVNGLQIKHEDPAGPGSRASLEGTGRYAIRVAISVGDAEVRIR